MNLLQETERAYALASQGQLPVIELFSITQLLIDQKHLDIAIQLYQLWLERTKSPINYAVQFNLAVALANADDDISAENAYKQALEQKPDFLEASLNLGTLLERTGRAEQALSLWHETLALVSKDLKNESLYVELLNNLGRLLEIEKQLPEAEAILTLSLRQNSKQPHAIVHWVHLRQKLCLWPIYKCKAVNTTQKKLIEGTSPLAMLSAFDDPELQLKTASRYVKEKVLSGVPYLSTKNSYGHTRLRIAYLSSDFCSHAVSILTAELYGLHDRTKFEVYGFCWSRVDGSSLQARVIAGMDHHIKIGDLNDEEAAKLIRSHEIDILIDLHGLTLGSRHDILSYRPAPLQLTWLGFPGSTALPEIDYVLCDSFVFPPELEPYFSEKPLRLPQVFQVNDRQRLISLRPTRESCGLPEEAFVFCSFNNTYKITPEVFKVWMRILKRVPQSILWLIAENATVRTNLHEQSKKQGISTDRILFAERALPSDYLARFQVADLFLDTFPFGGGTTASDALWAGLPFLTYSGKTFASRMAGSLLMAVDLPELITFNLKEYEDKAVKLAQHPEQIAAMKQKLVDNRMSCALFDTPRFVRDLEELLVNVSLMSKSKEIDIAEILDSGVHVNNSQLDYFEVLHSKIIHSSNISRQLKSYCIGHTLPLFDPLIPFEMLCPFSLGISNELVIDDNRFGSSVDGSSLAEYSQLFGLHEKLLAGDVIADDLFLFQYRKFISPTMGGLESAAPWVRVLTPETVSSIFPSLEQMNVFGTRLAVGSIFNFGESISSNYARVHVIDDLVMFVAACSESGVMSQADIRSFATISGIIPSPAVCYIHTDLFIKIIGILKRVWDCYYLNYQVNRTGYQRRVAGYLLERLHSFLLCKLLMDGSEDNIQSWQRYVVTDKI